MNKIIVYSNESFQGRSAEFKNSISNLVKRSFNDTIASIKVIGLPWVAHYDINFSGKCRVFEEGEYASLGEDKDKISSLQMITENLENPEIQLFEHINFRGRSVTLNSETNLHNIDFSDTASSHRVYAGVWVLYKDINRQGTQLIALPGSDVPNYVALGFNDVASHVRPLMPRP